jgi:hypothetical protein
MEAGWPLEGRLNKLSFRHLLLIETLQHESNHSRIAGVLNRAQISK